MKDLVESVELGVSKRKGVHGTRPKVWLRNELLRIGLAELLCTYVMMVRHNLQHRTITCSVIKRRKNASHSLQSLFPPSTLCLYVSRRHCALDPVNVSHTHTHTHGGSLACSMVTWQSGGRGWGSVRTGVLLWGHQGGETRGGAACCVSRSNRRRAHVVHAPHARVLDTRVV